MASDGMTKAATTERMRTRGVREAIALLASLLVHCNGGANTSAAGSGTGATSATTGTGGQMPTGAATGPGGTGATSGTGGGAPGCPLLMPIVEPSSQLFVAPGGSDSAAGTQAAPLATLSAAAKRFPMGGTVIVRGGTYGAQKLTAAGTTATPLVIRAAQGESPVFDGSALTQSYDAVIHFTSASNVVLEGLEVKNAASPNASAILSDAAVANLTIRGCSLHETSGSIARFSGSGIHFEGNEMYRGALVNENNPSQFANGGWPTCMGILPDTKTPGSPWATDVTIRQNHIHDCWGEGIGIWYGANVEIFDNVVERAFNVGIYMDDASTVDIERNFVLMQAPMALGGKAGNAVLLGVEPYASLGLAYAPDHDVNIVDNVLVGGNGVAWWTSSNTSPNNTFAGVSILENTIVAVSGAGIGFPKVGTGATPPAGCKVIDNAVSEKSGSYVADAGAFTFAGNAWLGASKPGVAGSSDVAENLTLGSVTTATDVEALASQVGAGTMSGVAVDFLCAPRSTTAPIRGAFEH